MMQPAVESLHDRRADAGFSLIEVLIATALLLLIVIGTIPLFLRSMLNNVQGEDASRATNIAIDDFERQLSLPFDSQPMSLPDTQTTLAADDALLLNSNLWHDFDSIPSGDQARFRRRTTLRQYNISDLLDDGTLDNPLPGGSTPSQIHLKVLDVRVSNLRMAGAPDYAIRVIQTF